MFHKLTLEDEFNFDLLPPLRVRMVSHGRLVFTPYGLDSQNQLLHTGACSKPGVVLTPLSMQQAASQVGL